MDSPNILLTEAQVAAYKRDGFLSLPALTTAAEVEQMRQIYDRLFAEQERIAAEDRLDLVRKDGADSDSPDAPALPSLLHLARYAPELETALFRRNAHAVARQLLGPEAEFMGEHAILKPPRSGAATPWHQDEAYWDPALEYEALSVWIPFQEATLENGCMQFVPGTHAEVLPHHHLNNDAGIIGLEADDFDASAAVACPIPPGGATVHHSRTLHYTGPNLSDSPRRAYILIFRLPPRTRAVPRVFSWA